MSIPKIDIWVPGNGYLGCVRKKKDKAPTFYTARPNNGGMEAVYVLLKR